MAKKVSDDDQTNTFDPKRVNAIIGKIEGEFEGLLGERMSYMGRCRPYRERIALHYEEGANFDIPKKILKAKIKERALHRQIEGIPNDFEDTDRETFEQVSQALGALVGTPLGEAALKPKRTAPSPTATASTDDDKDLRPAALKRREAERAAENGAALEAGIQPLSH